ncbi:MAG TPA: hypothetical protein VMU28_11110 [Terriglobales bacterium]|nr:hypothetical protein [Terriglobales bacterium]
MSTALATTTQKKMRLGTHQAHIAWMLVLATVAVVAGFATLNLFLADSGMAVLNEHAGPYLPFLSRVTRQG